MAKIDRLEAVIDKSRILEIANKGLSELSERELFEKIAKDLFKHSQVRFNKDQIRVFTSPCVYIFLRGNDVLYVGMSKLGIQRVFTQKGNVSCENLFRDADDLIIITTDTEKEARQAEKYLIVQLLPHYNRV